MVIENPLMPPRLGVGTVPNIVPFTMRENFSQMGLVEGMRHWINYDLIPFINANVDKLSATWVEQANALIDAFEVITTGLVAEVNGAVAQIGDRVEQAEAAKVAAEAARDLAAQYASQAEEIQDVAVAGITGDDTSATRSVLDGLYASAAAFDIIEGIIDGRLSEASMTANFAAKTTQETVETGRLSAVNVKGAIDTSRATVIDSDYESLDLAYQATPVGGVLEVRTAHVRAASLNIDKSIELRFNGGRITMTNKDTNAITVTVADVTITAPNLVGAGGNIVGTGSGIRTTNAHRLTLTDINISQFSYCGIDIRNSDDIRIRRGFVKNIAYGAVMLASVRKGVVEDVEVDTVHQPAGYVNSYGMAASRFSNEPIASSSNSSDVTFQRCIVRNVPLWEGFDTHGGIRIRFIDCKAYNCQVGFAIVGIPRKDVVPETVGTAAKDFLIRNCYAESGVTDGSQLSGLTLAGTTEGANAVDRATGIIDGLTIVGYGSTLSGTYGATYVHTTDNVVFNNVTCIDSMRGLMLDYNNRNFSMTNITVIDAWLPATDALDATAIGFRSTENTGTIANATMVNTGKYDGVTKKGIGYGMRAWSATGTRILINNIRVIGATIGEFVNPGNTTIGYELNANIRFIGAKKTVSGSRGGNAALASLLTALNDLGLITNNTVA